MSDNFRLRIGDQVVDVRTSSTVPKCGKKGTTNGKVRVEKFNYENEAAAIMMWVIVVLSRLNQRNLKKIFILLASIFGIFVVAAMIIKCFPRRRWSKLP
ncbi:hypothetical protein [Escherichia coli]|uniref:hypothetical protein n=1 Tax=Escherichia coli TaxID=562 RepID=UPI00202632E4|nr:hypothetical protein [Escherichia coli]